MRRYADMVESGDWPPTNRETIRMLVGFAVGAVIGFFAGYSAAMAWVLIRT